MDAPEQQARRAIDDLLTTAGWAVQDVAATDIHAARGVAIREFPLKAGHGFADYLLYVDGKAAGVIEAKKEGFALTGVETQSSKYTQGLPDGLPRFRAAGGGDDYMLIVASWVDGHAVGLRGAARLFRDAVDAQPR